MEVFLCVCCRVDEYFMRPLGRNYILCFSSTQKLATGTHYIDIYRQTVAMFPRMPCEHSLSWSIVTQGHEYNVGLWQSGGDA